MEIKHTFLSRSHTQTMAGLKSNENVLIPLFFFCQGFGVLKCRRLISSAAELMLEFDWEVDDLNLNPLKV